MLQILLSEWIVRVFLLYLFVACSVALIRHQRQAVSSPLVSRCGVGICDRWADQWSWCAVPRATWGDKYKFKDKNGIRVDRREQSDGKFRCDSDGLSYA